MDEIDMGDGVHTVFYATPWLNAHPFTFVTAEENGEVYLMGCYGSPVPTETLTVPNDVTIVRAYALPALEWQGEGYYQFCGWYMSAEGGERVGGYEDVAVTGGPVLYARWEAVTPEWDFYITEEGEAIITGYSVSLVGNVEIPSSVTVEEDDGAGNVTEVTYPVTAIEDGAFYAMDGIESVIIPASVIKIYDWAFEDCSGLTNVVFDGGMESIAMNLTSVFSGTPWLEAYIASLPAPSNDAFANATEISGASGSVTGTNWGASVEDGEPLPLEEEGNWTFDSTATVWWTWTAPTSGFYTFTTQGSDFDTVIGIYTGSAVDALEKVVANDQCGVNGDNTSAITNFNAVADTTYYIAVGGYENDMGNIVLNWSETVDEGDVVVEAGENVVEDNGDGSYVITPPVGDELTAADVGFVAVKTKLNGEWVYTTTGYDIVFGGGVITVSLKKADVNVAVGTALKDPDDKSGFLVVSGLVSVAGEPDLSAGETLGALPVNAVPGLWYQASWGADIGDMTDGVKVQATSETLYLGVVRQNGTSGFYGIKVTDK